MVEYLKPEKKAYLAEGNVIVSFDEYNKLNDAMAKLKLDQEKLEEEKKKLNNAIKDNMFMTQTIHPYLFEEELFTYDLSNVAEEVLLPILNHRLKKKMKEVYIEFKNMSWGEFSQWKKSYKENLEDM